MSILKSVKFQILIIVLITTLAYVNILGNEFVIDDKTFILNWEKIRNLQGTKAFFQGAVPAGHEGVYRPVRNMVYAIDYNFWGANPFWYHLQSIVIHLLSTVLVYLILRFFVRLWRTRDDIGWIAFFGALLFGVHPIHTETISYISASMETFGSLFFFASFYLYLIRKYKLSIALAFLAFFTYEMTLTLPLLILLYEVCFNRIVILRAKPEGSKILPYFFSAFLYLYIRIFFLHITSRTEYLGYSFYLTMLTMVKVFVRYIFLLILPINLNVNHNLVGDFPSSMLPYDKLDPILSQSIFDIDVMFAIIVLIGIFIAAIKYFKKYPFILFCIGWFFIALLPVSYIIPHGGAMAEKFLYIPSFGFVFLLSYVGLTVLQSRIGQCRTKILFAHPFKFKAIAVLLFISLAFLYSLLTFNRNRGWKDDISLFSSILRESPENLLANYTLGVWYSEKKEYDKAAFHYGKAIKKAPDFWEARYNLGNIYAEKKEFKKAMFEYKKVMELKPDFIQAKTNFEKIEEKR